MDEMEEVKDINLEELHHSVEIKDETATNEFQVDRECETQICKQIKCGVCSVIFTDELQLAGHIIVHTLTEELSRTIDPDKFSIVETSRQSVVFACKMCQYNTYEQGSFELHMKNHSDPKPYECIICDFKCASSTTLKYHMVTHSSEKLFSCKICKFQSPQKSILRSHLLIFGKKCLTCGICGSKFGSKQTLRVHFKNHSSKRVYMCKICGFKCERKKDLKAHSKANHLWLRM